MVSAQIAEPRSRHVYTRLGSDDVLVRPVRTEDEGALRALGGDGAEPAVPTWRELEARTHFGLAVVDKTPLGGPEGPIVGWARFRRGGSDQAIASVAVVVAEGARARGIGTLLLRELIREGIESGVERFRTEPHHGGAGLFRLFARFGRLKFRATGALELGLPRETGKTAESGQWLIAANVSARHD